MKYVMVCAFWYHFYNLKNVKNIHGGVLFLVKLLFLCRLYCEEGEKIDWMNVERRNKSNALTKNIYTIHCVKSVRIWSYSGPHFRRIFLHSFEYSVFLRIQSDSGKMWENVDQNISKYGHILQSDLDHVLESLMVVLNPADGDYSLAIFNGIF